MTIYIPYSQTQIYIKRKTKTYSVYQCILLDTLHGQFVFRCNPYTVYSCPKGTQ